ncbi:3-hydroxy-3-methylglutaryl-coenzyme A reductase-like isoform X2 [Montipora capricornis]|uniref:3-hydroxy-3-methylglutaryl-coenzyme A reductase-like isoform X2 n=1 Tax=Montipora capricornis TaxID=246305 RepID=UPI0035F1AF3D
MVVAMTQGGISSLFYIHGKLCSYHPVEVLLVCITGAVCLLTLNIYDATHHFASQQNEADEKVSLPVSLHMGPTSYFFALVCIYLQCKKLIQQGSSYVFGFVTVFAIFSCLVFSSVVANLYGRDVWVIREALPYFFLLSDFNSATSLVKHTLQSVSYNAVHARIAESIAGQGPTITLNTLVGALVIGVGTLSGVEELETICQFGCLSLITHYVIFMTFLPACLSLFLELSTGRGHGDPRWQLESTGIPVEDLEPNPVVQGVKLIMSTGLLLIHVHRWFFLRSENKEGSRDMSSSVEESWLRRFLAGNTEQIIATIFAVGLTIKYFLLYKDDRTNDPVEKKPTKNVTEHKESKMFPSQDKWDQVDSGGQGYDTAPQTHCIDNNQLIGWSIASEMSAKNRLRHNSFSKAMSEVPCNDSNIELRSMVLSRRRTLSEGNGPSECQSRDDYLLVPALERSKSNPPRLEIKERSLEECKSVLKQSDGVFSLSNKEIQLLVESKTIPVHQLEKVLKDPVRAVKIRRDVMSKKLPDLAGLSDLPRDNFDYSSVVGACCENVVGYMPLPVGLAGPLLLNGENYYVPMATTEGCLVASTNRGCRALLLSGGVRSSVFGDGMTRGPVVRFPSALLASDVKLWLEKENNFMEMKQVFDSTSRFARLQSVKSVVAGRLLFVRFVATTGDAMGMNMVSKGTEKALHCLHGHFPTMEVISLSGNFCSDKKATGLNWIEGRGKSVVCEAIVPGQIVHKVLKTSVTALNELNVSKNLVGSAMAGAIGGFNAHAANIVVAVFIATGQDPAQCVSSSNCITLIEPCGPTKEDLYISCTMPSLEVGTVGGGTILSPQSACLKMLGVHGTHDSEPGRNATKLAQIVCGTVLAGELSLLSALAAGHLVKSHLTLNRSTANILTEDTSNCAVL